MNAEDSEQSSEGHRPRVFISYSHKDKEFAERLDASLMASNIDTFLDEREIQIGDSIPMKIFEGIGVSTHLIYIVSQNSVKSIWVKEEFSVAKMKKMQSKNYTILPVLIDDIELPIEIIHVRYADFKNWKNPDSYHEAFLKILQAMGIQALLLGREEIIWYAQNRSLIVRAHNSLKEISNRLDGALIASWSVSYDLTPHYTVAKWAFEDWGVIEVLTLLAKLLSNIENDNARLGTLKQSVLKSLNYGNTIYNRSAYRDADKIAEFRALIEKTVIMLDDLRNEAEIATLASFSYKPH